MVSELKALNKNGTDDGAWISKVIYCRTLSLAIYFKYLLNVNLQGTI